MSDMATTKVLLIGQDGTRRYVETPCEPINEWLCITPEFGGTKHGQLLFSGAFKVTHIPSGQSASTGAGCIECARYAGQMLAKLDWPNAPESTSEAEYRAWFKRHPAELVKDVGAARELTWFCDAEECEPREVPS